MEALERGGLPPWRMPWSSHPNGRGLPTNAVSRRAYSGINLLLLTLHARRHSFRSRYWATFNQWAEMGATVMHRPIHVDPGHWGCQVVFFKPALKKNIVERTGDEKKHTFPVPRTYTLFAADQVHGAEQFRVPDLTVNHGFIDYKPAETAVCAYPVDVRHEGDHAYYDRTHDYIQLPERRRFLEPVDYYATLAHECAHHSEKRLNWTGSHALGELRAEIAACYLLAELGVPQSKDMTNHHAYIEHWLGAIRNDPRVVWQATSAASKASDHILSFSRLQEGTEDSNPALTR